MSTLACIRGASARERDERDVVVLVSRPPEKVPRPLLSSAAWLEESFDVDASDHLLGSFSCALRSHILVQGKLFVVRGARGGRVYFYSPLPGFGASTTRAFDLDSDASVTKLKNRVGVFSAIALTRARDDGARLEFCSLLHRDKTLRCIRDAAGPVRGDGDDHTPASLDASSTPPSSVASSAVSSSSAAPLVRARHRRTRSAPKLTPLFPTPPAREADASRGDRLSDAFDATCSPVTRRDFPAHEPGHVFHTAFDPEGALLAAHLRDNCGATELSVSRQTYVGEADDDDGTRCGDGDGTPAGSAPPEGGGCLRCVRFASYLAPTAFRFPNMPKRASVFDAREYSVSGVGEVTYSARSLASMRGAPYADCFVVETRVRVTARREGGTAVDVACRVEWKKSVNGMIKKLVHAGAKDQLKKSYAKMLDLAAERLAAHTPREREAIVRVGRAAFRRRRRAPSVDVRREGLGRAVDANGTRFGPPRPAPRAATGMTSDEGKTSARGSNDDPSFAAVETPTRRERVASEALGRVRVGRSPVSVPVAAASVLLALATLACLRLAFALATRT